MNLTGAIVLFAVIWFMAFLTLLPIRERSQEEAGSVVPGTPPGAPDAPNLKRKALWATGITLVIWSIAAYVLLTHTFTIYDIDWFNTLGARP